MTAKLERLLIVPDTHAPFHDEAAWSAMMKFARAFKPHTIVHLGDFADCFTISDHDKDPRRGTQLEDELKSVRALRQQLDDLRPRRKIITLGNHEFRLERYMMKHAPALMSSVSIDPMLKLRENGWKVVPYKHEPPLKIGKLSFTHDAGYGGSYAVNRTGEAFASSVVFGHVHRLGCTYFGDLLGNKHVSASLGWLGSSVEAKYADPTVKRFWQHGFGVAHMQANGNFQLQLIPIVGGKITCGVP